MEKDVVVGWALAACGTGMIVIFSVMGPGVPALSGPAGEWARARGEAFAGVIDGIPFPHSQSGALVKALLCGDRSGIDPGVKEAFRVSGASHILALSGLHLGLLYAMVSRILSVLGNTPAVKRARSAIIVLAALFYVLMTGAAPSLVRAFLFIAFAEAARSTGRKLTLAGILLRALAVQLIVSPHCLMTPGFQLSYMAVLGIALLFPYLKECVPSKANGRRGWRDPLRRIWEILALSISCQVFTAPVAWVHFHTFPRYFLLTNLMAMPYTTLLMAVSAATSLPAAAGVIIRPLVILDDALCQGLIHILETISTM